MRPPVQVVLAAAFLVAISVVPAGAAQARTHTVDYVIGMLEAGVDQPTILARIHDARLTFQIAAGDLDRLRDAGAGDALVQAVKGAAAAPSDEKSAAPGASSRPQRLGQGAGEAGERLEATAPERESAPGEEMEPSDGSEAQQPEESEEAPHGGYPYYSPSEDWGYDGYYPPYYVYYGPPYYYYPYYPYSFYYSFYSPYPFFHNRAFIGGRPGHGGSSIGRTVPRGTPRGGSRPPSGGMSRPRPRGH